MSSVRSDFESNDDSKVVFEADVEWANPNWEKLSYNHVHNWANYISDELKVIWLTIDPAVRKLMYENARNIASNEEWD